MKRLLILILVLTLLAAVGCTSQSTTPSAKNTASSLPTVSTAAPSKQATTASAMGTIVAPSAQATVSAGASSAAPDFANREITLDNVEAALSGFFMEGEYIGTDVENSGGTTYITIMYKPLTIQNENDFAVQVGHQAARVMEVLFSNAAVDVVTFKGNTASAENVIEINMSKDTAAGIDWTALIYQAQTDYTAILNVADSHHIDSSISGKLK